MHRHMTLAELQAGLAHITASPIDGGVLRGIVIRPRKGERQELDHCDVSLAGGAHGDHWAVKCWKKTSEGRPHPDVQICIMNARAIDLIAGVRENWALAGDNMFVDMNLTPENLPAGQRLAIGTAVIEITDTPHDGCALFTSRYGRDATKFVNSPEGKQLRLRGIYARVVTDGRVSVGNVATKLKRA